MVRAATDKPVARSTYCCIAFKFKHPDGASDEQIIHVMQTNMKMLKITIEQLDGELCNISDVVAAEASAAERIGTQSVADTIAGVDPR